MAEIVMITCDNPSCKSIGQSESEGETRKGKHAPPYGWIVADIGYFGSGPYVKRLVACDNDCLLPAFIAAAEANR